MGYPWWNGIVIISVPSRDFCMFTNYVGNIDCTLSPMNLQVISPKMISMGPEDLKD